MTWHAEIKLAKLIDPTGYSNWHLKILAKIEYCYFGYGAGHKLRILE